MTEMDATEWLYLHSGPVVKFRTLTELMSSCSIERVSKATEGLFSSQTVQKWLSFIGGDIEFKDIHSSRPNALENALNKLGQLGVKAGLQSLDSLTLPYRAWLSEKLGDAPTSFFGEMKRAIIAASLSNTGYGEIKPVHLALKHRLDAIHRFLVSSDWTDIYAAASDYSIPKSRHGWKLIAPSIYKKGHFPLPWIHDLVGFAKSQLLLDESDSREKINQLCKEILTDKYQKLPRGYGLVKEDGRFYVSGWSVHLPCFELSKTDHLDSIEPVEGAQLLLWLEALSSLPIINESKWFRNALQLLDRYETQYGTYQFPRSWLPEKQTGYWINGAYMALEEGRRGRRKIECESTFRMLKLKHQVRVL